ncbi:threonine/serine ThrE exporter family protein [Nonomuraea sediminis]|uniref:threonine/serine ThrE exporter family protein n=1 Tax=Nonomuraea sediminis TaxID=2835864 RepID=UPI001BDC1F2A|nr:threonine/serine exporter family protein [Nonomuraea sediminis]
MGLKRGARQAWGVLTGRRPKAVTVVPRADLQAQWTREFATFLCELGAMLVMAGALIEEVEDAIRDVAARNGARVRSFIVPTGVFVRVGEGAFEAIEFLPIEGERLTLAQIQALYSLVDRLKDEPTTAADAMEELLRISAIPERFNPIESVAGYAVQTVGLGVIQHATLPAVAGYVALGLGVGLLRMIGSRIPWLETALPVVAAALVTMAARVWAGPVLHEWASLMLVAPLIAFLPGTQLTMGVIELSQGDMLSGLSRLASAFNVLLLLAFGILVGTSVATQAPIPAGPAVRGLGAWAPWVGVALLGIGFVVSYSAPRRLLPWLLAVLLVARAAQVMGSTAAGAPFGAFVAGLVLPVLAHLVQRRARTPSQVLYLPSFWMLVPGSLGLASVSELVVQQSAASLADLVNTGVVVLAIALGVMVGASFVPRERLEVATTRSEARTKFG